MEEETVRSLIEDALDTDGAHHKQWYLERIYAMLGFSLEERIKFLRDNFLGEPAEGIAP